MSEMRHRAEGFIPVWCEKKGALPCARVMAGGYRCLVHMIQTPDEVLIRSGAPLWFIVSFLFIKVDREHECFDLSVQNKSSVKQRCRLARDELRHPVPNFEAG